VAPRSYEAGIMSLLPEWAHFDQSPCGARAAMPALGEVREGSAQRKFRMQGLKVARERSPTQRRTAMRANVSLHEATPAARCGHGARLLR